MNRVWVRSRKQIIVKGIHSEKAWKAAKFERPSAIAGRKVQRVPRYLRDLDRQMTKALGRFDNYFPNEINRAITF